MQINAYITPPQNRGFAPHYDVHDVFVLQVSGRKHWRIHAPVVTDPLDNQNWEKSRAAVAAQAEGEPLIDCVLEPGDALYLPRGTIHAAEALGDTSIHLTVGIHPITRYELVRQLARRGPAGPRAARVAADGRRPRRPGRARAANWPPPSRRCGPTSTTRRWTTSRAASPTGLPRRPVPNRSRRSPSSPPPTRCAPDTGLRLRGALRYRLTRGRRSGRAARSSTARVSLPAAAAPALKTALSGEPFTPADLPGLDADEQLDRRSAAAARGRAGRRLTRVTTG